jgi:hypothetical protein
MINSGARALSGWLRRITIHFWLICLVAACILPAAAVAAFPIVRSYEDGNAGVEAQVVGVARALTQAVDANLNGVQSTLQILATSRVLQTGDLAGFYERAEEALRAAGQ